MTKKKSMGVNIGSSSILLIFVILCLVSFATLSIVSANADYKLGQKILTRTTAYYEACNQAEKSIAAIDRTLWQVYETAADEEEYFATVGYEKSYLIPISDLQNLSIRIEILYPAQSGDSCYRIENWQVVNTEQLEYDDTLPVFQSDIP